MVRFRHHFLVVPSLTPSILGFSAFNGGASLGSVGLGVSPKEVNVPGMGLMQKGETPPDDLATKQCVCLVFPHSTRPLIDPSPCAIHIFVCASFSFAMTYCGNAER